MSKLSQQAKQILLDNSTEWCDYSHRKQIQKASLILIINDIDLTNINVSDLMLEITSKNT